jgi:predicted secreted protein with PEFG-CTERM motif
MKIGTKLMNKESGILVLLVIIIGAVGISPGFASPALLNSTLSNSSLTHPLVSQFTPTSGIISVTTDKTSYNDGDKIIISGRVQDFISDTPITLQIISPIGNIVKIDQVDLTSDRTFSTPITAVGALWKEAGAYTVKVQYGSKDRTSETTFQFAGSSTVPTGPIMKVDGTDFSVKYSIANGKVLGMKIDTASKSLIVSIQTTGDGSLTVTLPRGLIDAKLQGQDGKFAVLTEGLESDFEETSTTATDRTLSIPFTDGTTQIEIIGTFAIPEFGAIASIVFAIAIVSIITVSAKTRLGFMSRQ